MVPNLYVLYGSPSLETGCSCEDTSQRAHSGLRIVFLFCTGATATDRNLCDMFRRRLSCVISVFDFGDRCDVTSLLLSTEGIRLYFTLSKSTGGRWRSQRTSHYSQNVAEGSGERV